MPDINGKHILDLGCGFGSNCIDFINQGASSVTGIDVSEKMIEVAKNLNSNPLIEYKVMDMSNIQMLPNKFDLIFSSLAFHYVENFPKLLEDIYHLLNKDGILLFSQEHPITTAPQSGPAWTKDDDGNKIYFNLSDYMISGKRNVNWFQIGIEKYHRTISEIINSIIGNRFRLEKIVEPIPNQKALKIRPDFIDEYHKTTCIIIKAIKV